MARKFIITTSVGKRKFVQTFNRVSSVDAYLAGAKVIRKQNPKSTAAKIRIQTKETGKKLTKGIVKFI
jgi:hypothetical protein